MGKWAFLVGISHYDDNRFPKLDFADKYVSEIQHLLQNCGEYEDDNIFVLNSMNINRRRIPTRSNIISKFVKLLEKIQPKETLIIFFVCHGGNYDGENYIFPQDASKDKAHILKDTSISLKWFTNQLEKFDLESWNVFFFIDACREHISRSLEGTVLNSDLLDNDFNITSYEILKNYPAGLSFLFSCSSKQKAWTFEKDNTSHSVFSYALIEGIKKGIEPPITYGKVVKYTKKKVEELIKYYDLNDQKPRDLSTTEAHGKVLIGLEPQETKIIKDAKNTSIVVLKCEGAWEDDIFILDVQIINNTRNAIGNVNVYLDYFPSVFEVLENRIETIPNIQPNGDSWISEFRLYTEKNVYSGNINSSIKYFDLKGKIINMDTDLQIPVKPHKPIELKQGKVLRAQELADFESKDIKVLRGGDWRIEGNQSVFHYKVKIANHSKYVITDIQIMLSSLPSGLEAESDREMISFLSPESYISPTFKLKAKSSCVGDYIRGLLTFRDPKGRIHSVEIHPFEISYVCNLLVPSKPISMKDFEDKIKKMKGRKIIIESDKNIEETSNEIKKVLRHSNMQVLDEFPILKSDDIAQINALAQGLYDKKDVALSVYMKEIDNDTTELVIKAMSDKQEKLIDLLKDFSIKLDNIKSDSQMIKEYSAQIEEMLKKTKNPEKLLKDRLGKDFEKLKYAWLDYQAGEIDTKEFVYAGVKVISKQFIKLMLNN